MNNRLLKQLNVVFIAINAMLILGGATYKTFPNGFGIDQAAPVSSLDVSGNATIGSNYSGSNSAPTNGMLVEGDVGIGATSPNTKLDLNGDVAFRATTQNIGTAGGTNNFDNLALNSNFTFIRVTGPSGNYEIRGITGGVDGRLLILRNASSSHDMKLTHEEITSSAANRIIGFDEADMNIKKSGSVMLIYDATSSRWMAIGKY